jgi:glucosylceramidase
VPVIVNASAQEYYKQPMYYALAHFSKFLPKGFDTNINIDNFISTAFLRPDNGIVVIVVNTNDESVLLTIENSDNRFVVKQVLPHSFQSYIWCN